MKTTSLLCSLLCIWVLVSVPAAFAAIVDTPVVDTPVVDTPVVDTPVVDTPVVDTPSNNRCTRQGARLTTYQGRTVCVTCPRQGSRYTKYQNREV
ncbi:MAG: hypothetical protein WCI75_15655, partial [candidate division NC10 bacterium]